MLNQTPQQIAIYTDEGRDDNVAQCTLVPTVNGGLRVEIEALPHASVTFAVLRWAIPLPKGARILGDHWERAYGDLEWRGASPERSLPWYALIHDPTKAESRGIGVETGVASFASWRVDETGVTLVLDVRSGGMGVLLGGRRLVAATIHDVSSNAGETLFTFARRFCTKLCPTPRLPSHPVYGGNDWYFRYGANSAESVRVDSALIRELSPSTTNAPYFVIDAGWSPGICDGGPYDRGTAHFSDMAVMAAEIRDAGVRPGIWIRPLLSTETVPATWTFPASHPNSSRSGAYLDPSVPEVLARVRDDIARLKQWGYDLIKHDFTTFDTTGRWGFEMGPSITSTGWAFADRTQTTAEIIAKLYSTIRDAAQDSVIIGCNTVGHLGAGLFELQRTGDDTSGMHWERTRKMGINTLAFRMPQHNTFFAADADCVGITSQIPWDQNKQWLDLLARSGTPLFVSADPNVLGPEQKAALTAAFAQAALSAEPAEPLDWLDTTCPRTWRFGSDTASFEFDNFPGTAFSCPA